MTLRQKLGIHKGTVLDFEIKDNKLMAIKTQQPSNIKVYGCLGDLETDKIMQNLRGKPPTHHKILIIDK